MNMSNYLYIFNQIVTDGDAREGRFYLDEFSAWHDFDGYTCYIGYKDLTMTLYFHNRFSFDYSDKATLNKFNQLVEKKQPEKINKP